MWIRVVWWIHVSTFVKNFSLVDGGTVSLFSVMMMMMMMIIIIIITVIIIIIIYCNWIVTRWQWLFYMYTKYEIGYY